jgi:Holliday junction DNA helicase RuvA
MIAHLRGKLIHKQPGQAIVEAAGVGYDVTISVPTFTALPSGWRRGFAAHPHPGQRRSDRPLRLSRARRETSFRAADHRQRRRPQAGHQDAQRALPERTVQAIRAQDHAQLTRIPGVGKKLAERL